MGDGPPNKKIIRQHQSLIEQNKAGLVRVDNELEKIRGAIAEKKDRERGPLLGVVLSGVFLVVATVGAPVAAGVLDNPTPVSCSTEKEDAYDLWKKTGVWKDVPASSPSQEQCDVNGYMADVTGTGDASDSS